MYVYLDSFVSSESDNSSDSLGYGLFTNNSKALDMTSMLEMTVGGGGGGVTKREKAISNKIKGIFFITHSTYVPPQSSTEFSMAQGPLGSSISFSMGTPMANTRTGSGYTCKHTRA